MIIWVEIIGQVYCTRIKNKISYFSLPLFKSGVMKKSCACVDLDEIQIFFLFKKLN